MAPLHRNIVGSLACLAMVGLAADAVASSDAAGAGPGYSSADAPLGEAVELAVDIRGRVAARCELVAPPQFTGDFNLNRDGEMRSPFQIDCNAPFEMRVRSDSGGLAALEESVGAATLVPAAISVDLGTDAGTQVLGWCQSDQLSQGGVGCAFGGEQKWSSGNDTAINRSGVLRMQWRGSESQPGERPAYGRYRDTIVIEVGARS